MPVPSTDPRPLEALGRVLASVDALRNGGALFAMLATFAGAGLLLAMVDAALSRGGLPWAVLWGGLAATVLFYGTNTAGLLLFDQACGRPVRDVAQALRDALACAHGLLLVGLAALGLAGLVLAGVAVALWMTRLPLVGPALFGLILPALVVIVGLALLAGVTVLAPLAAPAIWSGLGARAALASLLRHVRQRLAFVALLMSAVSGLAALVAALVTFAVMAAGRLVAALAVPMAGIDLPPQLLMAGLFGHGLRGLGATGVSVSLPPHGQAALAGGGVVFVLGLVLPALVYLRGACAVYLTLQERDSADATATTLR